jgi:hypothetical protein
VARTFPKQSRQQGGLTMPVAGGRPDKVKEKFMIKDDMGYTMTSKRYVKNHPELFRYDGHIRINSTIFHIYLFLG